jgi:hypothetical protein
MSKFIEIKTSSELVQRYRNFLTRWDVVFDSHDFNGFRNCVLNILNDLLPGNGYIINELNRYILHILRTSYNPPDVYLISDLTFSDSQLGKYLTTVKISTFEQQTVFLWCLENILNHYVAQLNFIPEEEDQEEFEQDDDSKQREETDWRMLECIADGISEVLEFTGINAKLCQQGTRSEYFFYPKGADILDEKLVNDNLNWLENYPQSREKFHDALLMSLKRADARSVIDNMRFAFEFFLREFLNSDKSLENQKNVIGQYFKGCEVPVEISNMYSTLLSQYAKYQNENVKHGDTCSENEVEFMIYLTGTFIRFLIQTKNIEAKTAG